MVISVYPSKYPLVGAHLNNPLRPHSPLSEISTAALILHIQHRFCQSHSDKRSPKHTHPWVAPLFSSLQHSTGTSCKHSKWTVLTQSLHSKTQSWTLLLTVVAALRDALLSTFMPFMLLSVRSTRLLHVLLCYTADKTFA
jgi:hypothetical protein